MSDIQIWFFFVSFFWSFCFFVFFKNDCCISTCKFHMHIYTFCAKHSAFISAAVAIMIYFVRHYLKRCKNHLHIFHLIPIILYNPHQVKMHYDYSDVTLQIAILFLSNRIGCISSFPCIFLMLKIIFSESFWTLPKQIDTHLLHLGKPIVFGP